MTVNILFTFTILFSFFPSSLEVNWQGYGNMSASNLTAIWNYIYDNVEAAVSSNDYASFSQGFSDNLNQLWHPAWNIVTVKTTALSDAILYGYAFRNHWMWYNNYIVGSTYLSFVIWKDYNCGNWKNIGQNVVTSSFQNTYKYSVLDPFYIILPPRTTPIQDIWLSIDTFMKTIVTKSGFTGDKAFTAVASQDGVAKHYGRVCIIGDNHYYSYITRNKILGKTPYGKILLFQTR